LSLISVTACSRSSAVRIEVAVGTLVVTKCCAYGKHAASNGIGSSMPAPNVLAHS
jgi:hypothetical protein